MYPIYRDLRDRLGEPLWHDRHGVPRYARFHPSLLGIYDDWAVLFLVQCQGCPRRFECAAGANTMFLAIKEKLAFDDRRNADAVLPLIVGWGDAPWHDEGSQCAGTTMTTDVVAILQVWRRQDSDWSRVDIPLDLANRLCDFGGEG